MESWLSSNAYWILPLLVAAIAQWEINRLHRRIDAILKLLKLKGIDVMDPSTDVDDD